MQSYIGCIYLTFLHSAFSNVSSNCLHVKRHSWFSQVPQPKSNQTLQLTHTLGQTCNWLYSIFMVHNQRTFYYFFANKKYPQLSWVGWTTGTGFYRYVLWIYEFLKTLLHNIQHAQHSGIHCVAVVFSYICFLRVPLQIAMHCWSLEKAFITCTIFRDV